MSQITYPKSSPYAVTPQLTWRLSQYKHRRIPPASTDTLRVLPPKFNNSPDRLSYDLYCTQQYWWVFMLRNMNVIREPVFDMRAGISIYVPPLETINTV